MTEREIIAKLKSKMQKGRTIKVPDFIIFCGEGVILLESKSTKYSQDIYEQGLDAHSKACVFG